MSDLPSTSGNLIGYSPKISDPAFKKYIKNSNRYAIIFALILSVIGVVGFYIAGEMGLEGMSNPESLYIGLGFSGMMITISLLQVLGKKRSRTWDGTIKDKKIEHKTRQVRSGNDKRLQKYTLYKVIIVEDHNGKKHILKNENNATLYDYYQVGERVRHHAGLNGYEKYDKSHETHLFCAACAQVCPIEIDYCTRCKLPLLK